MPGDLPINQVTVNITNTSTNSCARFWGTTAQGCNRFLVTIEKVS